MSLSFFVIMIALILGACAGSFAHAVAWRAVRGRDWVFAPSVCYACARRLNWRENLPIIGYLRHLGRCGCGMQPLPSRYFLTEFILAVLFATSVMVHGVLVSVVYAPYLILLAIIFCTDFEAYYIPNWTSFGGVGLALVFSAFELSSLPTLVMVLIGAGAGYVLIHAINMMYKLWRGQNGFGGGDAKLMALIGAWSGIYGLFPILLVASIGGALFGIVLIMNKRARVTSALPFGCFLVPSAVIWYFLPL